MRRPRILLVSGNAPPVIDGVGGFTARLLVELRRRRPEWNWRWLARRPRWFHFPLVARGGIPLYRPAHTWSPRGQDLACAAARWIRPDLVHVQEQIHSFHETAAAVRLARATKAAIVTTLHEYHVELPSVVHTNDLVKISDIVISNDPRNASRCLDQTGRIVDRHAWSGAPIDPPNPPASVSPQPGLVVTFGFLSALKSFVLVHAALAQLRKAHPAVRWRIVGPFEPATNPYHAELARTLNDPWIEFTGAISEPKLLQSALAEAELMVLPFADGASLRRTTLHTAWALGLPVVTTPPAISSEALEDGSSCLLVREGSVDEWSDAIGRVMTLRALASQLRAGSLDAAARYSWDRLATLHLEVYDSLLGSRDFF
jgi:glycosyltransferase involved in cell wall biosynthesis